MRRLFQRKKIIRCPKAEAPPMTTNKSRQKASVVTQKNGTRMLITTGTLVASLRDLI